MVRPTDRHEESREPGSGSKRRKAYTPRREERQATASRDTGTGERRRRYRPGRRALMEIRHLQKTTHLLIRKMPFVRVVREIARKCSTGNVEMRWQLPALECMQEESMCYPCETCHHHAERYPFGKTNPWSF